MTTKKNVVTILLLLSGLTGCSTYPTEIRQKSDLEKMAVKEQGGQHVTFFKNKDSQPQPKISRQQQALLAVDAAVDERVHTMLASQPLNRIVYFTFSSPAVEARWDTVLTEHVSYLNANYSARLLVAGFTDTVGSAQYNFKLGKKRASNVCHKLIGFGVRPEQITCVSYGETHPADPGSTEESRARNRRVELLY